MIGRQRNPDDALRKVVRDHRLFTEELTSRIRHERDWDALRGPLRNQRLVTLAGTGAVGKTRSSRGFLDRVP